MATKQTNIRIDKELLERYEALGAANDRTGSYYIRKAVESFELVQDKPKAVAKVKKEVVPAKKAFDPKAIFADGLNTVSWAEWCDFRKEKRNPVSARAASKQFKLLCEYDFDTQREIIDLSISNDYAGLFPPKSKVGGGKNNDALNSTSWADGLSDSFSEQDDGRAGGQLPGVAELGARGEPESVSRRLSSPATGGDEGERGQFRLNGESWHGQG